MGNIFTALCSDENVEMVQDRIGMKQVPVEQAPPEDTSAKKVLAKDKKATTTLNTAEKTQVIN